ncbi:MAG: formylmethanofuran dehydrogenase subunit E family protein [Thermoplasmata archaeon]|nr:MAG: formylmethanofuran dehydrogenase subunit E family protein [Thermoplasmata archaeon]
MDYDLPTLSEWFHGHYQPYIALGIRMGELALDLLEAGRHEMKITSETGTRPTYSCLTDGLQLATGSTIGNGRLKVLEEGTLAAIFSKDDRQLRIEARDFKFDLDHIIEAEPKELFLWTWE